MLFFGGEVFGATELERRELLNQLEIICCIYTPIFGLESQNLVWQIQGVKCGDRSSRNDHSAWIPN